MKETTDSYEYPLTMKKTLRPTFLLRSIVLLAITMSVVLTATFASSLHFPVVVLIILVGIWFIGIEMGVLPTIVERFLVRKAETSKEPANSLLFLDLEKERRREMDEHKKTSSDNPTIR